MSGSGGDPGGRATARPRRATVAGVTATVACLLLVVSLFDAMTQIGSLQTQSSVRGFLSKPPGDGTGLSVEGAISLLRGVVLLNGALAAAGAVLAGFALRRHRGARLGLSVVAVLMMFSASFVAGFLPVVVAVAAGMLWSRESRDWFDGRQRSPWPAPPPTAPAEATKVAASASWPPSHPGGQAEPVAAPSLPPAGLSTPGLRRPVTVSVAAWLTWVCCGLSTLFFSLLVLTLLAQRTRMLVALHQNPTIAHRGLSDQQILGTLWVVIASGGIFWSLSAIALAVLAFRRVNAGRVALAVSAVLAGLVGMLAVPFGWLNAVAAFTAAVLLLRGDTRRWYAEVGPPSPGAAHLQGQADHSQPQQPPRPTGKPPVW